MNIESVFAEVFGLKAEDVTDDIQYQSIEKWDSLNHLRFTSRLEEVFDIDLDMDDIIDMSSVARIKEILRENYGVPA